jgi:uncharacterized protein YndB with AHSA1/START domain
MQDIIQREVTIKASKENIYDAIINPAKLIQWFPDAVEGTYEVGESPIFDFGKHGKNKLHIVAAKPFEYFSYRWVPGAAHFVGDLSSVATTLVEFKIQEETVGMCKVIVTESGFASLPAEVAEKAFGQNSDGWTAILGFLGKFFQEEQSK